MMRADMDDESKYGGRERLARDYAKLSDLELLEIAAKEEKLDEVEKEILTQELAKRELSAEVQPEADVRSEPGHTSGPLVVVKRFTTLSAASLAKSVLDSAEIDSILTGDKIMGMVYPNLIGAVKLVVRPEDLEAAVQLLSQTSAEEIPEETPLEELLRKTARPAESGGKEK
jgi:hypothetical protein